MARDERGRRIVDARVFPFFPVHQPGVFLSDREATQFSHRPGNPAQPPLTHAIFDQLKKSDRTAPAAMVVFGRLVLLLAGLWWCRWCVVVTTETETVRTNRIAPCGACPSWPAIFDRNTTPLAGDKSPNLI